MAGENVSSDDRVFVVVPSSSLAFYRFIVYIIIIMNIQVPTSCARCTWLRTGFSSAAATGGRAGVIPARHCFDLGDKKKPIPSPRALKPVGGRTENNIIII